MKDNRVCIVCGGEYSYCPHCSKDRDKPTWMTLFDKKDCNDIFHICCDYRDGVMSKDDAKKELQKCDLSNKDNFEKGIRAMVEDIIGAEEVVETPVVTYVVPEENEVVENISKKSKKKNIF